MGIDCLEHYRKKLNEKTGAFMEKPEHDRFSHGADAFRTLAVCYQDMLPVGHRGYGHLGEMPQVIRSV